MKKVLLAQMFKATTAIKSLALDAQLAQQFSRLKQR
jgi:hypothetical protein